MSSELPTALEKGKQPEKNVPTWPYSHTHIKFFILAAAKLKTMMTTTG